jgi:hypothetical protein
MSVGRLTEGVFVPSGDALRASGCLFFFAEEKKYQPVRLHDKENHSSDKPSLLNPSDSKILKAISLPRIMENAYGSRMVPVGLIGNKQVSFLCES